MIDWVKAIVPMRHLDILNGGNIISIDRDGVIEWSVGKRLSISGSHDKRMYIKSENNSRIGTGEYTQIVIDGNPAKFLQGHNLWGSDDLIGLVAETMLKITGIFGIEIQADDWNKIINGNFRLQRVDSTCMVELGNQANVQSFLHSAERTAHMRYKGQSIMTSGTLYFGKKTRYESLKMYSKYDEIKAKGHELPIEIRSLEIDKWVSGKLRIEVCSRAKGLKRKGLNFASKWGNDNVNETINRLLGALEMSEQNTLDNEVLTSLPHKLRGTYGLWKSGHDMRVICKSATFKRHRKELKKYGIDIGINQSGSDEPAPNVIDFRRVLTPTRCEQIPSWAIGTPLYFEPRDFKSAPLLKIAV